MTERLAPTDAAFFYNEEPAAPLHVGGVVLIEPAERFDFSRLTALIDRRLAALPRFRQVVHEVPGRLARPVWVDDTAFDLDYHVRRSALPQPGRPDQLAELVGRLISRPLDRTRPLWELYVVEGLDGGRVALINKTHQTLVGGTGVVDIVSAVLDEEPDQADMRPEVWIPAPAPSPVDLVIDAIGDIVARPSDVIDAARLWTADLTATAATLVDTGRVMIDVARRSLRRDNHYPMRSDSQGPRLFVTADLDLAVVKKIRRAHGGTVNDVILTIITGAIRSWLLSRGDPVAASSTLVALAPTAISVADEPGTDLAPAVASTLVDLPIAEPSAVMRLHQVSFQMSSRTDRAVGADTLLSLGRFAPAALHGMGARVAGQLSRRSYDLLVTNVPGPQHDLFAAGDRVASMYPIVPLAKGHALAIGATSYRGRIHIGITVDRTVIGRPDDFAQHLTDAAAELARPAPRRSTSRRSTPRGTSRRSAERTS